LRPKPHDQTRSSFDAVDRSGSRRFRSARQRPDQRRHGEPGPAPVGRDRLHDEDREAKLTRHQEVTRKIARKGDVVVIDNGGRLDVATWGEFHCYACKQNGAAGAVVDGATRDAPDVRASGFPTFVRGLSPVKSQWDLKTAAVNEPVMLGPVQVNPGDIIFADETAVVVIPAAKKAMVLEKANDIRKSEDANRATLIARA
jgi:regulator of RNase E activity RraA